MNENFIGLYENVLTQEQCQLAIDEVEHNIATNPAIVYHGSNQFSENKMKRFDYSIYSHEFKPSISQMINAQLSIYFKEYLNKFFVANEISGKSTQIKLQKTPPKGGYNEWHCEAFSKETSCRYLGWTIYLNDIPNGEGETEFFWQGIRVQPKTGLLCIFPASFTHMHKGNTVYSCNKYIATGWLEFNS